MHINIFAYDFEYKKFEIRITSMQKKKSQKCKNENSSSI